MTGRKLGNYLLLEEVGRGGMGSVYKAKDLRLDRVVAVKLLTKDLIDENSRRRFLLEAKAVSALNDPGIVTLHDIGTDADVDYLVMEFVDGVTLTGLIPPGGLPVRVALQYAERIARALSAAHAVGIVHRDLKPGNVMVKPSGELKVLDFGLAKLSAAQEVDDQTRTAMTRVGLAIGTPSYMSPEQSLGEAVDHRSDIFSLGVMLYEMLAGKRPFSGRTAVALVHSIHYDAPPPIEPPPPASVSALVKQALEKDPARRHPTMESFATGIRHALAELDSLSPAPPPPGDSKPAPQPRRWTGIAAGLALCAALAAAWFYSGKPAGKAILATVNGDRPAHQLVLESRKLMNRADVPANVEKAVNILRAAVEGHPAHAASHASLALALLRTNDGNPGEEALLEAQEHAARAVALDPQLALAHVARGGYLYAVRQLPDAEMELTEAVKLDPGNGPAHLLLGILYYRMGNIERSRLEYQDAVRLLPDDFEARSGLAALHYHRGDYKDAERESLLAVKLAPDSPRPHQMLGSMYYAQGRLEEAVREYQAALEMQPSASAYSNLGTVYFFREMYTQAAAAFEKATTLQPDRYLYWGNLADAYRWIPDAREKSFAAYDRAIALARAELKNNPADLEKRSRLAVLLAKRGDRPAAAQEIHRVEQNRGEKTGPLHYRIAVANELIGDRDKALASLALAILANYAIDEIRRDPELAALRNDERYARLTVKGAK